LVRDSRSDRKSGAKVIQRSKKILGPTARPLTPGEVYRATATNLKRRVAIKVLHIHGLEKSDGTIAFVMELVQGPTLTDRIASGAIP